jgi:hypothetical protein
VKVRPLIDVVGMGKFTEEDHWRSRIRKRGSPAV